MSSDLALMVRPDLSDAQAAAWRHVTAPGAFWTGVERARDRADGARRARRHRPVAAMGVAHERRASRSRRRRTSRGRRGRRVPNRSSRRRRSPTPGTTSSSGEASTRLRTSRWSASWWRSPRSTGSSEPPVSTGPPLPEPVAGEPHGRHPDVESATLNWVPVAVPADRTAAVVQALSAAPAEFGEPVAARRRAVHPRRRDGRADLEQGHAHPQRDGAGGCASVRRA